MDMVDPADADEMLSELADGDMLAVLTEAP